MFTPASLLCTSLEVELMETDCICVFLRYTLIFSLHFFGSGINGNVILLPHRLSLCGSLCTSLEVELMETLPGTIQSDVFYENFALLWKWN